MGIPELWDTIRDYEETIPIAQLAEEHFKRHGRPLRIAVDEADWRFNNVTRQQVYAIRESSGELAYQGIEKHMFYRICRLLTLNIQLVFVFDGPGIPWKRGRRGGGRIDWDELRLLKQMLTCFGIPYQEAPGEAEAECARLQILGLVDAVWSQDSDCLMFGCTYWIHDDRVAKEKGNNNRSKENTKKNAKTVRVVRASDMQEKLGLTREALVLFAMLVGGDYDTTGLPRCGANIALQVVKNKDLAESLVTCQNQRECSMWSGYLAVCLQRVPRGGSIPIPPDYPNYKTLQKYWKPKVSGDQVLLSKTRLGRDNPRPIDELSLLEVTSSRFNIWGKGYMHWVGPVLLVRSMAEKVASTAPDNIHEIKLVKQRAKKGEEGEAPTRMFERKISFSPFKATSLQRKDFEGERIGYWAGSRDIPFDPSHRVDCELPDFWLAKTLPPDVYDPPAPGPKSKTPKRKQQTEEGEESVENSTAKKPKPRESIKETNAEVPIPLSSMPTPSRSEPVVSATSSRQKTQKTPTGSASRGHVSVSTTKRRGRPPASQPKDPKDVVELSDDEYALRLPSKGKQYGLAQLRETLSSSFDLGLDWPEESRGNSRGVESSEVDQGSSSAITIADLESDDGEDHDLIAAIAASLQDYEAARVRSLPQKAGEFDRRANGERFMNQSSPAYKASTVLPPNSSTHNPRQQPSEEASRAGPTLPLSSLRTPSKSSPAPFASPIGPMSTRSIPSTPVPSKFAAASEAERIREARIRHFAQNSSPQASVHPTLPTQSNRATPSSKVPDGILCIDLTDD